MRYKILTTDCYDIWHNEQTRKTRGIINSRIERLALEGYWGYINAFDGLIELKWTSGLRVYVARIDFTTVVLLNGGNKNGQDQDIKKAKAALKGYT